MSDKKLILVVDDDPDLVESVSMKLESENFTVQKAYDGEEALQKIQEKQPDLVLLDVMMPKKNGYELCDELKSDAQYKDIIVVLLTAVGDAVTPPPIIPILTARPIWRTILSPNRLIWIN